MSFLKGRANRAIYWICIALAAVFTAGAVWFGLEPRVSEVVLVILCVPRLHDLGRSGWWMLLLVPLEIGQLVAVLTLQGDQGVYASAAFSLLGLGALIWLGVARGDPETNRFGPPPPGMSFKKA